MALKVDSSKICKVFHLPTMYFQVSIKIPKQEIQKILMILKMYFE
jgi:hypothetical protein